MWKTRTLLALPIPRRAPTPASEEMSAFLWDWSTTSCPQSATTPPKNWALSLPRPKKRKDSSKGWGSGTFAGLLFSNLVSLLLGAGLGVWIYRRWSRPKFLIFSPLCKCIDSLVIISKYFFLRACGMHQQIVDILPHVHVSTHLSCFYAGNQMFIQMFTKNYDQSSTPFSGPPAPLRLWSDPQRVQWYGCVGRILAFLRRTWDHILRSLVCLLLFPRKLSNANSCPSS